MNQQNVITAPSASRSMAVFAALMRKVYLWMTLGLAMTGMAAAYVASRPDLVQAIFGNRLLFWGLVIAELAIVLVFTSRIMRLSFATAGVLFAAFSLLNGVTLSSIFLVYDLPTLSSAFLVTAGMFAAMSVVGFVIKRDLSGLGRFLIMALIGLIIATVVNMFVASSALYWATTYIGVFLFAGLTAYDTQKIKLMLRAYGDEVNAGTMKLALLGSLTLYLDFINLFLYLLRFFGASRD